MSKRKKAKWDKAKNAPGWIVAGCIGRHGRESYQNYRNRGFYSGQGEGSAVRRVDPESGNIVYLNALDKAADEFVKNASRTEKKAKKTRAKKASVKADIKEAFYKSWEWRQLRMEVLKQFGRVCMCCGATSKDKIQTGGRVRIVVDHIKPISRHWELRLERSNLQVLCDECNQGKGNWDETDYRPTVQPSAWSTAGKGGK